MMAASPGEETTRAAPLDLKGFQQAPSEEGLSLDQLSAAFAQMLSGGSDPYAPVVGEAEAEEAVATRSDTPFERTLAELSAEPTEADAVEVSPLAILEAMLFVGHPQNVPLSATRVAELMRGVRPAEVDEWVRELNEGYVARGAAYRVVSHADGFRLELRPELNTVRRRLQRRERLARLSQAAIEVLAVVAYNQGATSEDLDRLRGRGSGHLLAQLVRRQLLRVEREGTPRVAHYFTTPRFLRLFQLERIEDLPRAQDVQTR